ncbi:uncharacterized protein LOC110033888 isoform X2 [Phalaenopsis equestris]|uniref:uncharacterized protein LOC110033888 isoform X2 n=1 Tax=Phalaenopsis equestris TaxID=78828 RepID=UPI0009E5717A|nr:uncharacterized protein LOC110033888 isoform X2 [Phalaenopsis equestris]
MADDIFHGLPPPSATHEAVVEQVLPSISERRYSSPIPIPSIRPPALKSALKRDKHPESPGEAPQKRLRFKTTVDATEAQVIEAMKKITSHIKVPSKFSKASKLAIQLIQAGSVKPENSDYFFALLDAAMSSPTACNEPLLRADYHAMFSAVQEVTQCFSRQQKNVLATWMIRALVANDLYTDDSFVKLACLQYSKAAGKIKDAISSLPAATVEDDGEESEILGKAENADSVDVVLSAPSESDKEAFDPFGLDALLLHAGKKNEKSRGKEVAALNKKADEEEHKKFVKAQREVLLLCLEIAARRYKVPWCQTVIDILAKYAFDHIDRFTLRQREAIEKLWTSIKEQQIRRKQGKSVTGKLDMNAFEWLQEKYSREKISIRHSVGGGGERQAQQWLG